MYTVEEFDKEKSKVVKYIVYKKRTEREIRNKFQNIIEQDILEDIIDYLKQNGYINDKEYIQKAVREFMILQTLSIQEIRYKLYTKGLEKEEIEDYMAMQEEELEDYELASAKKIVEKKKSSMEIQQIKQYLTRKGYLHKSIKQAIEE